MSKVIKFPTPKIDRYVILHDPATHRVEIPLIPDEEDDAIAILAVLARQLVNEGTIDADTALQVTAHALGMI